MLRRHVTWRPWCQGVVASAQSVLWLLLVLLLLVVVAEVVVVVVVGSGGGGQWWKRWRWCNAQANNTGTKKKRKTYREKTFKRCPAQRLWRARVRFVSIRHGHPAKPVELTRRRGAFQPQRGHGAPLLAPPLALTTRTRRRRQRLGAGAPAERAPEEGPPVPRPESEAHDTPQVPVRDFAKEKERWHKSQRTNEGASCCTTLCAAGTVLVERWPGAVVAKPRLC